MNKDHRDKRAWVGGSASASSLIPHPSSLLPSCPVCESADTFEFLRRPAVPVHQNLLLETAEAARGLARGDLAMYLCARCGFGFNAAFRPELLDYGRHYDNTQNCSPAFDAYMDGLVRELVERHGVRRCRVVEVGCGKGAFLKKLVGWPGAGNSGVGFDPAYVGPDEDLGGHVRFERRFYDAACAGVPADVVVCRHVIEHVARPAELLRAVRAALAGSPGARVFFETPCLEWVLRRRVSWDFFYEHCSLFTPPALAAALTRAGFGGIAIRHVFQGQYLWLEARAGAEAAPAGGDTRALASLARAFAREDRLRRDGWEGLVRGLAARGPVAVWGAGAKGVTFCNLIDPDCRLLRCVIDVNPAKQGKFVAGTGHRIVGPNRLWREGVTAVLVLNPNYAAEVAGQVARASCAAVFNVMHGERVFRGKWAVGPARGPRRANRRTPAAPRGPLFDGWVEQCA